MQGALQKVQTGGVMIVSSKLYEALGIATAAAKVFCGDAFFKPLRHGGGPGGFQNLRKISLKYIT